MDGAERRKHRCSWQRHKKKKQIVSSKPEEAYKMSFVGFPYIFKEMDVFYMSTWEQAIRIISKRQLKQICLQL